MSLYRIRFGLIIIVGMKGLDIDIGSWVMPKDVK